jgi:hypothetical protein
VAVLASGYAYSLNRRAVMRHVKQICTIRITT